MSAQLIPGPDIYPELLLIGTIIASVAYGIVIMMFVHCFRLLLKMPYIYSKRMRGFIFFYITVMFLLSTLAWIQQTIGMTMVIFRTSAPDFVVFGPSDFQDTIEFFFQNGTLFLPFTILGADVFMLWRCLVLYQGASRLLQIFVFTCLSLILLTSLGNAILFCITPVLRAFLLAALTALVNLILALLIVLRLVYHQRRLRKMLGVAHGSGYARIMAMCIESCALIVIFSGVYGVLFFEQANGSQIPLMILPHIYVISPYLIIAKVAQGRAATTVMPSIEAVGDQAVTHRNGHTPRVLESIRFNPVSIDESHISGLEVHDVEAAEKATLPLPLQTA
ncbi:hypothetical protein BDZ97DRAFT_1918318 [Flammula alnicola]|nr:hypothetical protein BDZ97DRAFT_1918318 [Flammula alnicola]